MIINLIVAVDSIFGIGCCNAMPWGRIKEDMQFFRETTKDKVVIMGGNTYLSIGGKPLQNRINIVLTRQTGFEDLKVDDKTTLIYKNSLEDAFEYSKEIGYTEVFIMGGEEVYRDSIEFASTIYITHIANNYDCDRHFPQFDETLFLKEQIKSFMYGDVDISIFRYTRTLK